MEYDAGTYSHALLRRKLGSFEAYPFQVWGVADPRRASLIRRLAQEMGVQNLEDVLLAPWA